jgi:hypothetical protein
MRRRGWASAALAITLLGFVIAPSTGDYGGCNQAPDDLDPGKFFAAKKAIDCKKCHDCNILSDACVQACEPQAGPADFPHNCYPLVHDGEACLHMLQGTHCEHYRQFMSDTDPLIPTECNFCPPCDDGGLPPDAQALPKCE